MSDVYLNAVQLNTSNIRCNITAHAINKPYIIQSESVYGKTRGVTYPASGNIETYEFQFTLIAINAGTYTDLLTKGKAIYNELLTQVTTRVPMLLKTNDTEIYLNFKEVYVLLDEFNFKLSGEQGTRHLDFTLNCSVLGAPIAIGGTINPADPWV